MARVSRRTQVVWLSFFTAMTLVIGLLVMGESGLDAGHLVATSMGTLGDAPDRGSIFQTDRPLDRARWTGIVIHHLGQPAGDAASVHSLHLGYGYQGLGYHFLIGNGNGLGDGMIQVGYRWNEQQPGAHVARSAPREAYHNEHSVAICLVGNGERRPFTDRQMRSLVSLVRRLQLELNIPAQAVHLHRDLAPDIASPGRYFALAELEGQFID